MWRVTGGQPGRGLQTGRRARRVAPYLPENRPDAPSLPGSAMNRCGGAQGRCAGTTQRCDPAPGCCGRAPGRYPHATNRCGGTTKHCGHKTGRCEGATGREPDTTGRFWQKNVISLCEPDCKRPVRASKPPDFIREYHLRNIFVKKS